MVSIVPKFHSTDGRRMQGNKMHLGFNSSSHRMSRTFKMIFGTVNLQNHLAMIFYRNAFLLDS